MRSWLNISDTQGMVVALRQASVRLAVEKELTVLDTFLTGSYKRSTLIAPLSEADVDIVVVLDPTYFASGASNVLQRVKAALGRVYPQSVMSRNGQAVTIKFSDLTVDVVPAFHRQGGGFLICNSGPNTWISTDPKRHIEIASAHNTAHNGKLVPVVKILKGWNREIDRHFRSFHLEVIAWDVFSNVRIDDDASAVRYFFEHAQARIRPPLPDPAGYSADVGAHVRTAAQIDETISRLRTAHGRALNAERYANGTAA
jgi:hypothetical protein